MKKPLEAVRDILPQSEAAKDRRKHVLGEAALAAILVGGAVAVTAYGFVKAAEAQHQHNISVGIDNSERVIPEPDLITLQYDHSGH